MSIATKALSYGWKIVAGAVLTGATIYTPTITRWYITQRDVVPIVLGTVERCLATQYLTNTFGTYYRVVPPEYIRRWVSTNGVGDWENETYTNTLSWYTDHALLTNLDAKIFALIRYYVDTNTVYTGSTNISMLTVTGLFASLQIGDHTNRFTAIPAIGTNPATYGPWAWRNYITAWQERYKVLNALTMTKTQFLSDNSYENKYRWIGSSWPGDVSWEATKLIAESYWAPDWTITFPYKFTAGYFPIDGSGRYIAQGYGATQTFHVVCNTQINHSVSFYGNIKPADTFWPYVWDIDQYSITNPANITFDGYGDFIAINGFQIIDIVGFSFDGLVSSKQFGDNQFPTWTIEPTIINKEFVYSPFLGEWKTVWVTIRGYQMMDAIGLTDWQFLYCTNKYW